MVNHAFIPADTALYLADVSIVVRNGKFCSKVTLAVVAGPAAIVRSAAL